MTKFLLQSSTEAAEYEAALIFAQNLKKLMTDSHVPVHAKYTVLLQKGDMGEAGICLAEAQEQFRTNPNYITDRLAYTIEVMGTAAARKYLDKIHDVPAFEPARFWELCARIYNAEGEEMNCIKCLYILLCLATRSSAQVIFDHPI